MDFRFDSTVLLNLSSRHKFVAQASPLILAALVAQHIDGDTPFSVPLAAKSSVELASKLYDEILTLREPDENDDH